MLGYYYMIRHKESGEFMPEMRRGKGYSHWNPSTNSIPTYALGSPRLFDRIQSASRSISQWFHTPNGKMSYHRGGMYGEEYDDFLDIRPDNRKKEDLEIVQVEITEVKLDESK